MKAQHHHKIKHHLQRIVQLLIHNSVFMEFISKILELNNSGYGSTFKINYLCKITNKSESQAKHIKQKHFIG